MRSQVLLRRTRAIVNSPAVPHRALLSSTRVPRYPRKDSPVTAAPHLGKRASSSVTPTAAASTPGAPEPPAGDPKDGSSHPKPDPGATVAEEVEKPKRRTRTTAKEAESSSIPSGLDILWLPDDTSSTSLPSSSSEPLPPNTALPPPEIFHEVLTNLHITFHPQTQHSAAYASHSGPPVEPTLALYCPIEGGDYIVDETVRELGRQAGAEVVVLDAVQLAAGECGYFGKAASVIQLPNNPLHFAAPPAALPRLPPNAHATAEEDDDEDDMSPHFMPSSALTFHVLAPISSRSGGRTLVASRRTSPSSLTKMKAFFDELINIPTPVQEGSTEPPQRLPRIIYIRDFPTLAGSSSSWYPALLAAVRQRRQGALARPSSPVANPTTIVFGMTPSIVAPTASAASSQGPQGLLSILMNRQNVSQGAPGFNAGKAEYTEGDVADKARERRLRDRLRRWERGDYSVHSELPQLSVPEEDNGDVVVVGGPEGGMPGLPPVVAQAIGARMASRGDPSSEGDKAVTRFFRTSFIVPSVRSVLLEKACRMDRRREINELTMRMGVATVGGVLEKMETNPDDPKYLEEGNEPDAAARRMWEHWGRSVEVWSSVRKIADRAVGKVIASQKSTKTPSWKTTLDATPIPWDVVYEAWTVQRAAHDMRKAWVQQSSGKTLREDEEDDEERVVEEFVDETIERVKRDPDLDKHEQRLLGCIVDTASISTTFNHVHLPAHTIDSVRTIVSLPLLHPTAFQHGILKEHTMTGCLLFGPPGTGKTLVVRALAKEAGCRMLSISPSDVMDMYVGEGEKLVRAVFSLARRLSPCVVFIDELDALFGARAGMGRESGGAIAHRGVITEFMQEMDGLKSSKDDNVIVIGATNRPFDLDDAVLRRLPRRLLVDLPGEKEREEILKILLRDEPLAADVDLKVLAHKTETFSGSDLKHLCVSAALDAVKERVDVPWRPAKSSSPSQDAPTKDSPQTASETSAPNSSTDRTTAAHQTSSVDPTLTSESPSEPNTIEPPRTLYWRNFNAALKEITPSSSESLGSLAELRKWNDEFGEGRREKKKQVWGKGRFGFTVQTLEGNGAKVQPSGSMSDK